MTWVVLAFFAGGFLGFFLASLLVAAQDNEWKVAYLACRDQLWRAERPSGDAA